jgi:hypothetical protein
VIPFKTATNLGPFIRQFERAPNSPKFGDPFFLFKAFFLDTNKRPYTFSFSEEAPQLEVSYFDHGNLDLVRS